VVSPQQDLNFCSKNCPKSDCILLVKVDRLVAKADRLLVGVDRLVAKAGRLLVEVDRLVAKAVRLLVGVDRLVVKACRLLVGVGRFVKVGTLVRMEAIVKADRLFEKVTDLDFE
jgi:hypothetical protein